MTPHFMPQGHCISKLYLFAAELTEGRWIGEKDVVISSNGLACALRDVGRGYAQAAVDASNLCRGADAAAPWAAAYQVPRDHCLFSLPAGWTSLEFVAFPVGHQANEAFWQYQAMARSQGEEDGWMPVGMLHHDSCEGTFYLPHGAGMRARVELPRSLALVDPSRLNDGSSWKDLQEMVLSEQQNPQCNMYERMEA